jgi:hypothetical protein
VVVIENLTEYNDVFFDAYSHKFKNRDEMYSKQFHYFTKDLRERKALEIFNSCENIDEFCNAYEKIRYDKIVLWNGLKRVEAICEEGKYSRQEEEEKNKNKGKRR